MNKKIILQNRKAFLIAFLLLITGCSAHYPVNESIDATDRNTGYRPGVVEVLGDKRSDTLLVILAFSGGHNNSFYSGLLCIPTCTTSIATSSFFPLKTKVRKYKCFF